MKVNVILFLCACLCSTLAEPLRYRSAKQKVEIKSLENESSESQYNENDKDGMTEPTIYRSAPAPYPSTGWIPVASAANGQLLVFPIAVRENVKSTTADVSETADGEQDVEADASKTKQLAAHKRPGPTIIIIKNKKSGELKVEANQESTDKSTDTEEKTTETSEPTEADVDCAKSSTKAKQMMNDAQSAPSGFFVQLPDGSFQQIIYFGAETSQIEPTLSASQPATLLSGQIQQAPNDPLVYYPFINPKTVTFSTQYNAW